MRRHPRPHRRRDDRLTQLLRGRTAEVLEPRVLLAAGGERLTEVIPKTIDLYLGTIGTPDGSGFGPHQLAVISAQPPADVLNDLLRAPGLDPRITAALTAFLNSPGATVADYDFFTAPATQDIPAMYDNGGLGGVDPGAAAGQVIGDTARRLMFFITAGAGSVTDLGETGGPPITADVPLGQHPDGSLVTGVLTVRVFQHNYQINGPLQSFTALSVAPNPALPGQTVTLTATVQGDPAVAPTGPNDTVTFRDGARALGTVRLTASVLPTAPIPVGVASLQIPGLVLGPGRHELTATFNGDSVFPASTSPVVVEYVGAGPHVSSIRRFGFHAQPTSIVLTFDEPLDTSRAADPSSYRLTGAAGRGRPIPLRAVIYDPAALTVTLDPALRLNLHRPYQLTVVGTGARGVADSAGNLLDGAGTGQPGSDFVTRVTWRDLTGPAPVARAMRASRQSAVRHGRR